jgi:hypothetical protein
MPQRWFHEGVDIITWGRSYWRLHKKKDQAHETLGYRHRTIGHPWYQQFGRAWNLAEPFPTSLLLRIEQIRRDRGGLAAEIHQAAIVHDYLDRLWDQTSQPDRVSMAEALRAVLLDTKFLLTWAAVDVVNGRIKVTYGPGEYLLFPIERWEPDPSLPRDHHRLVQYIRGRAVQHLI